MQNKEDKRDQRIKGLMIAMASVSAVTVALLMTGCVAAVPVAVPADATVVHTAPVAVAPVAVRPVVPVAPVARAASPVGVHGTARRTSRRVARRR